MPPKGKDRTRPVNEQILVEAARIYDNRELRDEEDDVKMMKGTDLMSFSKFLSKQDAFTKVSLVAPRPFRSSECPLLCCCIFPMAQLPCQA